MAVNTSAWSDAQTPANASFTDEAPLANSAFAETNPNNSAWARTSGIDTSIPTYSDATISYSDPVEYYSGYDGSTITEDDVKFSAYADAQTPSNSAWSDIT